MCYYSDVFGTQKLRALGANSQCIVYDEYSISGKVKVQKIMSNIKDNTKVPAKSGIGCSGRFRGKNYLLDYTLPASRVSRPADVDQFVRSRPASPERAPVRAGYSDYCSRRTQILPTGSIDQRRELLNFVNVNLMPRLPTEEAALQLLLSPVLHQEVATGWPIHFRVTRNLKAQSVDYFSECYQIVDIFSNPMGGYALFLEPEAKRNVSRCLILIPGTHPLNPLDRDALAMNEHRPSGRRPTGQRDDSRLAIGAVATKNLKPWLDAKLQQAAAAGRELTVAGHSLGGAVALRWFASLQPGQHRQTELIAFMPPNTTRHVAYKLIPVAHQIRIIQHRCDIVPYVGFYQAPGRIATITDTISEGRWKFPHAKAQLALRELRGEQTKMSSYKMRGPRFNYFSIVFEPLRLLILTLLWPFLRD